MNSVQNIVLPYSEGYYYTILCLDDTDVLLLIHYVYHVHFLIIVPHLRLHVLLPVAVECDDYHREQLAIDRSFVWHENDMTIRAFLEKTTMKLS